MDLAVPEVVIIVGIPPMQALSASEHSDFDEVNWQQGASSAGQVLTLSVEVNKPVLSLGVFLLLQHPTELSGME